MTPPLPQDRSAPTRRTLLGAIAALLAATDLALPPWLHEVAAHEGAADGKMGGRHGKSRRGRKRKRTHGDQKHQARKANQDEKLYPNNSRWWVLPPADWLRCKYRFSDCSQVEIKPGADLTRCNLCGADLRDASLRGVILDYANLSGSDLRRAVLKDGSWINTDLHLAWLVRAKTDANVLSDAHFCRTFLPNGYGSDRDCDKPI